MRYYATLIVVLVLTGRPAVASPPIPIANFSASNTSICGGQCISFTDLSSNNPTSWSWTFQGASVTSSTQQHPANICYHTPGTYFVSLTVSNASGSNTLYLAGYISVYPSSALNLLVNGDFNNYNTGFSSQLTYVPTGVLSPDEYTVDTNAYYHNGNWAAISPDTTPFFMSDGSLTTGTLVWSESITNIFPSSTYTFSFLMTNLDVNHTFVQPELLTTITDQGGTILFSGSTGLLPAQNTNNPPVFVWTQFAFVFSTLPNTTSITISLNQVGGQYLGFDFGLEDINLKTQFCDSLAALPSAALLTDENLLCPGSCADFQNLSVNATSCQWFFPGGSPATSSDLNPQEICYYTPGSYDVTLIATNASGSDTVIIDDYILVNPYPPPQGIVQSGDTLFANPGSMSYQWYQDGIIIAGATSYFYVAPQSGNFNVVATDSNGCQVEAVIFDVVASIHSVLDSRAFTIYPNPATDKLILSFPAGFTDQSGINTISIFNWIGEEVSVRSTSPGPDRFHAEVSVSYLAPGMYWLEVSDAKNLLRSKFIRQ